MSELMAVGNIFLYLRWKLVKGSSGLHCRWWEDNLCLLPSLARIWTHPFCYLEIVRSLTLTSLVSWDLQFEISESSGWNLVCYPRSNCTASFESGSIWRLSKISWFIASFSPIRIAQSSAWRVFSMPTYFKKPEIQFPFSSPRHIPAPRRDLDIEPSVLSLIHKWGGGSRGQILRFVISWFWTRYFKWVVFVQCFVALPNANLTTISIEWTSFRIILLFLWDHMVRMVKEKIVF